MWCCYIIITYSIIDICSLAFRCLEHIVHFAFENCYYIDWCGLTMQKIWKITKIRLAFHRTFLLFSAHWNQNYYKSVKTYHLPKNNVPPFAISDSGHMFSWVSVTGKLLYRISLSNPSPSPFWAASCLFLCLRKQNEWDPVQMLMLIHFWNPLVCRKRHWHTLCFTNLNLHVSCKH